MNAANMQLSIKHFLQNVKNCLRRSVSWTKNSSDLAVRKKSWKRAAVNSAVICGKRYGLTYQTARELSDDALQALPLAKLKKMTADVKGQIKALGNVNVNAIEEYKSSGGAL